MDHQHGIISDELIEAREDGVSIRVEAQPGAKVAGVRGINTWRRALDVAVTAAAQKGRANRELCQVMAKFFDVAPSEVNLLQGNTNRTKVVAITGMSLEAARAKLLELDDDGG